MNFRAVEYDSNIIGKRYRTARGDRVRWQPGHSVGCVRGRGTGPKELLPWNRHRFLKQDKHGAGQGLRPDAEDLVKDRVALQDVRTKLSGRAGLATGIRLAR